MLAQCVMLVLIAWALYFKWQKMRFEKLAEQVKCSFKTIPFIGHAYLFSGTDEDRMNTFKKFGIEGYEQGGLTSAWMANRLYVVVSDPAVAEVILKNCMEKDDVTKFTQFVIGNGSIFAPVPIWRPRRKILAPTFSPRNLVQFIDVFSQQSRIMTDLLAKRANGPPFSLWSHITTYTMDSVCETTLGIKMNAQLNSDQPFLHAFEAFCEMTGARMCQPWLYHESVYKLLPSYRRLYQARSVMHKMVDEIIRSKRLSMKNGHNNNLDEKGEPDQPVLKSFLDLLIESSGGLKGYSNEELREEILVLVMAGTDTSAVGIAFASLMLARHPDVQEKLYQDLPYLSIVAYAFGSTALQEVFGSSDRFLVADDLPRLKYMEAVIKETLRLYPPVPITVRKVEEDFTLPSGITLVNGCGVLVNMWAMHRNPQYWGEDADRFRPERFLEGNFKHPSQFMPFSNGPRNCLGYQYAMQSMKTALATMCRRYKVLTPPCALPEPRVKFDIMMKDVDNFMAQIVTRK